MRPAHVLEFLQVPGCSSGVISLDVKIFPSVALYHWQLFTYANLRSPSGLAIVWQAATKQYVSAYRQQGNELSLWQDIPAVKAQARMFSHLHCSDSLPTTARLFSAVMEPVRPMLQLTQVLLSQTTCDATHTLPSSQSSSALASATPINSEKPQQTCSHPDDWVALLQVALLTLRLITLVSSISAESASATVALSVLLDSLVLTMSELRHRRLCISAMPAALNDSYSRRLMDASVALTKAVMLQLRQDLLKPGRRTRACCLLLSTMLTKADALYCFSVQVAAAIKDPGEPAPHVAFAGQGWPIEGFWYRPTLVGCSRTAISNCLWDSTVLL